MSATPQAPSQGPSDQQVVIVGAGPVGLWLAHELAVAGVTPSSSNAPVSAALTPRPWASSRAPSRCWPCATGTRT